MQTQRLTAVNAGPAYVLRWQNGTWQVFNPNTYMVVAASPVKEVALDALGWWRAQAAVRRVLGVAS